MNITGRKFARICLVSAGMLFAPWAAANEASERLLGMGMASFEGEDVEQSVNLFEQALIADPADAQVRFWLGRGYWQQEEITKARRAFDQAIAIDPAHQGALYWGGLADLEQNNKEAAEDKYTSLEKLCSGCEETVKLRTELDKPEEEPFLDLFAQNDEEGEDGDEGDETGAGDENDAGGGGDASDASEQNTGGAADDTVNPSANPSDAPQDENDEDTPAQ